MCEMGKRLLNYRTGARSALQPTSRGLSGVPELRLCVFWQPSQEFPAADFRKQIATSSDCAISQHATPYPGAASAARIQPSAFPRLSATAPTARRPVLQADLQPPVTPRHSSCIAPTFCASSHNRAFDSLVLEIYAMIAIGNNAECGSSERK
jgi:hypothetical protein